MARIHNFAAGPAVLPQPVLEKAREELLDYAGCGMSVMEMSHRGKVFDERLQSAEKNLRTLMSIPDTHCVLFLQGGASMQFAMEPLNLLTPGSCADYVHTGTWAGKAIKEAQIVGQTNIVWDGKDVNYMDTPDVDSIAWTKGAAYAHICSNETIGGVRWPVLPRTEAPLVADMSSDIMSREINVADFGLIYAGAQKNLGPSGMAVVILRRDLAERCPKSVNVFLRYATHMKEPSVYNTPNTWGVYVFRLVTDWMLANGGVAAMQKRNEQKAALLYDVLDSSPFWKPCAAKRSRSIMNVTWRLGSEELEAKFVADAKAQGMDGLKGHRSVGGIRASIYNACTLEAVQALCSFMRDFERRNG